MNLATDQENQKNILNLGLESRQDPGLLQLHKDVDEIAAVLNQKPSGVRFWWRSPMTGDELIISLSVERNGAKGQVGK